MLRILRLMRLGSSATSDDEPDLSEVYGWRENSVRPVSNTQCARHADYDAEVSLLQWRREAYRVWLLLLLHWEEEFKINDDETTTITKCFQQMTENARTADSGKTTVIK